MEPITAAIVALVPELATDTLKSAVKAAYEGLKAVIRRKWGASGPIKAIAALEDDPKSKAQAGVVEEKIRAVNANEDCEVLEALRQLVEQMKAHGIGGEVTEKIQINISGGTAVQGVMGAERVEIGSMTFSAPPRS